MELTLRPLDSGISARQDGAQPWTAVNAVWGN